MTDTTRDLIERMARKLDLYRQMLRDDRTLTDALADEARAFLDQPEPEELTDEELDYLWTEIDGGPDCCAWRPYARAVIAADRARTVLAQPEPEGPSDRIISIAMAAQECAFAWEPTSRLIGNVCAEDIADLCGAVLTLCGRPAIEAGLKPSNHYH